LARITATYRVQLRSSFGFDAAAELAGYLADLGVSHLYSSPYLRAVPGSEHGYDVVDPTRVSEDLGGSAAHTRFCQALETNRLGHILDVVPNHMATAPDNRWWWDVLENGHASRYAAYFDIEWNPPESKFRDTLLVPILGDHYGRVLEAGEIELVHRHGGFTVRYHDHGLPVAPRSLDTLLHAAAARAGSDELAFLADAHGDLPLATATDRASVERRHRDKEVLRRALARLCDERPEVRLAIDAQVAAINADADSLDALLERQNYRLAFWRAAQRDLGYRRFFDIDSLVAVRAEDPAAFRDGHALVLHWLANGVLDGVRVDHVDGLYDPEEYVGRLREAAPGSWIGVEKILGPEERLRETWPVAGTTGYDFLAEVGGLFVDPSSEADLTAFYREFTGEPTDFAALAREKKRLVLQGSLGSDLNRLTALWLQVCERHRRHRDYTRHELHEALREALACFPVYRSYVRAGAGRVHDDDVRWVTAALEEAKAARADLDPGRFDFLADLLLLRVRGSLEGELAMRFQQLSGPVTAKGVEDTAFYCFHRLVSLNEVGGDPGRFGTSVAEFHRACAERQARWPQSLLATSTHDTKRGEDVRTRIHLLSEIPERWAEAVRRWSARNERHRRGPFPDRGIEYLTYQTLLGAWPIGIERLLPYLEKAAREAKMHTSWTEPNAEYESALRSFAEGLLADDEFRADFASFVAPLVEPGRVHSLAQTLVKLTAPGVPDLYQGTELWDASLVDPDNRRPVDYDLRRRLLGELKGATPESVWARLDEGVPKLWVIARALALRRTRPELFGAEGRYEALPVSGARAEHAVAFLRGGEAATVVPRLVLRLGGRWLDTAVELPAGTWTNDLTGDRVAGGRVALADLFRRFPAALLSRDRA
jgi:(1->4)-alpha-D-glucan 1-alpha-D-glucosylmutase